MEGEHGEDKRKTGYAAGILICSKAPGKQTAEASGKVKGSVKRL